MAEIVAGEPETQVHPAGWVLVAIVIAIIGLVLLSGIPGRDRIAGNGSEALRHGWAQQRAAAAQSAPAAPRASAH